MQYRHPLLDLQLRLDKALRHIAYLDKRDGSKYMATNGLTYQDICNRAEDEWKKLVDNDHWAPARSRMDPRRVPAKFQANVAELSSSYEIDPGTLVQALALVQARHPETLEINLEKGPRPVTTVDSLGTLLGNARRSLLQKLQTTRHKMCAASQIVLGARKLKPRMVRIIGPICTKVLCITTASSVNVGPLLTGLGPIRARRIGKTRKEVTPLVVAPPAILQLQPEMSP